MRVIIDYEASWRNSFLDGSNDEPLPRKGRNFVASMTELKNPENFHERKVTKNTVMGILSRLIGDQRKLYDAKASDDYYFAGIEPMIDFLDKPTVINQETAYIRNIKGSTDQNSFTGMIKVSDPIFQSDYSDEFWQVLALDVEQLCQFICNDRPITAFEIRQKIALDPVAILARLDEISKLKPLSDNEMLAQASQALSAQFDKYKPKNAKGQYSALSLYCSALYLQLLRLSECYDVSSARSPRGGISGISNNGFTLKDFMDKYTTGAKKLIYGNPYIREASVEGEGRVKHNLTKASGQLEIILNIDLQKAMEIKQMIDNAGVSSFYLGKKGLAYVSDIRLK